MRVIIIRCGALGDLVYATSVIDAILFEYGEDTLIDFVTTPGSGTLFREDARVHRVFPLKHKKIPLLLSAQKKAIIKSSKESPYDILLNFESGKQFKSLVIGIDAKSKRGDFFDNYTYDLSLNRAVAIKEYLKEIVSLKNRERAYPKVIGTNLQDIKKKYKLQENYIILSPSNSHINRSGINYRAWQNEKWRELIDRLSKEIQVVIVGAKGEESFFQEFHPYPSNVIDLVAKNSISELCGVIEGASGVICTDSAVGHIAAATNTPVFVLMGPNDTHRDSPYQTPHNSVTVISLNLECSPCYKTPVMKACRDNICMKNITVKEVYNSIKSAKIV